MLATRRIALSGFLMCLGVIATSFILTHWKNLESCLLCNSERVIFLIVGIIFLTASFKKKINSYFLGFMALFFSLCGVIVSGWQVYLQNKPIDENATCLPPGSMMDSVRDIIHGTGGDCSQVVWKFLGLSMAAWALTIFVVLFFTSIFLFIKGSQLAKD